MDTHAASVLPGSRAARRLAEHCNALACLTAASDSTPRERLEGEVGDHLARFLLSALAGDHRPRLALRLPA